jgi:hypothetical protein
MYAWNICTRFGIKPSNNPIHIGWLGRKQATDFTSTTLQTWRQTIPEEYYELKGGTEKDSKHILIMNRIAIDYGGLDRQETINKFNSAEYAFFGLDQAEETVKDDIAVIRGSLRLTINGEALPYKEVYTANPASCWLKDDFITDRPSMNIFVPALPGENPHLPAGYTKTLEEAFGYRPELLQAYLYGNWNQLEGVSQVILEKWLMSAQNMTSILGGRVISCDPARFGDDKTIIQVINGTEIERHEEMGYSRTTEISSRLAELSRQLGNLPIVVDEIGVGGGVCDELYTYGRRVIPFNGAAKAENEVKFYNQRAEAWWELAEHLAKSEAGCRNQYRELRKQLTIPTYLLRNGKILIEPKDKIKERLGRSPDDADCYVQGVWAAKRYMPELQFAMPSEYKPDSDKHVALRGFKNFN